MFKLCSRTFATSCCAGIFAAATLACGSGASPDAGERGLAPDGAPQARLVTMTGCVTRTSDPEVFVFAVPGDVLRTVRGIGEGRPVPPGSDAGPAPATPPTAVPPEDPVRPPLEPQGRYATPTVRNVTYRLEGDGGADLRAMVGHTIEVTGMLPTEGYPSGDLPEATGTAGADDRDPALTPLHVRSVRFVTDGCPGRK